MNSNERGVSHCLGTQEYFLYFDDTGSRDPDHNPILRDDGMNCFGLGGVVVKEEDVDTVYEMHRDFCSEWGIDYSLHSTKIRGGRGKFGWLKKPEVAGQFFQSLEEFLIAAPVVCISCVIHRPGYVERYKEAYQERMWLMCKTAFSILIERSAKFADERSRKLRVFCEQSGKKEDRDIVQYMRQLKSNGHPFCIDSSNTYDPMPAEEFKRIVMGEPRRKSKKVPMIQLADLFLYPMAKAGYDQSYRPFKKLKENGKLIDCFLKEKEVPFKGIKYSCFES